MYRNDPHATDEHLTMGSAKWNSLAENVRTSGCWYTMDAHPEHLLGLLFHNKRHSTDDSNDPLRLLFPSKRHNTDDSNDLLGLLFYGKRHNTDDSNDLLGLLFYGKRHSTAQTFRTDNVSLFGTVPLLGTLYLGEPLLRLEQLIIFFSDLKKKKAIARLLFLICLCNLLSPPHLYSSA